MGWEIHSAKKAFAEFANDWDRLNGRLFDNHPYFDSRFIAPLLNHFANGDEKLCVHRTNGEVSGALILQPEGLGRWSSFRPSQTQATAILLDDARLLESLFAKLPGLTWTFELHAVDPRFAPDFSVIAPRQIIHKHARTIGIELKDNFESYWKTRSKKLVSNLDRYRRRAEAEGRILVLRKIVDGGEIASGVRRFGDLETAGWKGAAGTAVSSDNRQGAFYEEVLRRFAETGQAAIYELRAGDRTASSRLVVWNGRIFVFLKTTYDESLSHIAPGRILLNLAIRDVFETQPGKNIEFYTNATRDLAEWATFESDIRNIGVFRSETCASAFSLLKVIQRNLRGPGNRRTESDEFAKAREIQVFTNLQGFVEKNLDIQDFSARDSIEVSIDWFDLLQRKVYPNDPGVRYYVITEKGCPATILPLRLTAKGRIRSIEALGNYYTSLYTPLLTPRSDVLSLRCLLAAATREQAGAHIMRFSPMDTESLGYKTLLNELRAIGWIPFKYFCFGNWYLPVRGDWVAYLKNRSANLRSTIKRRNKEFSAAGGSLEIVTADGIEQAIEAFQEVYSSSWKVPEPYPEFVPSLIRLLGEKGMLRIGLARINGKPVAAQLWIVTGSKASIYKLAYHEAYASLSPGTILTGHLMQHVIDKDRVAEVDFLTGDDKHKRIWMSHRRERWGIVAYNPRTAIGLALLTKEIAGRTAKSAAEKIRKMSPKIEPLWTSLAKRWSGFGNESARTANSHREQHMIWNIHPIARFSDFSGKWDALVQSRPGTPFLESAFLQPVIDVFGSGDEQLCLFFRNGQLRAGAIMQRTPKGTWQTFQPSQLPLGAFISDGRIDLLSIFSDLARLLPGFGLGIGFSQLDSRIQPRPHDGPRVRTQDYIQTAWLDIEGDFDTYWESRGKNLRQNTRKQRNKLQAEGITTRIECITRPEDVPQAIEDYGKLESAGWKASDGTAILPDNAQGRFYRRMLENFCSLGRGRIYRYWFGEKVVAMDLCIHDHEAIVILKTAYDEEFKSVSPSTLMRQEEFQQLFSEGKFARIEFYGKVMEWHTRWTSQYRDIYHATSYRWSWLKQLHARQLGTDPK